MIPPNPTLFAALTALVMAAPASALQVEISEPMLIAEGPASVKKWGPYQFPSFGRMADGSIAVTFSVSADSAHSYGHAARIPNRGVSSDGGRTWKLVVGSEPTAGLLLANGDRIRAGVIDVTPRALDPKELTLPAPAGHGLSSYRKRPLTYYRHADLPPELQGVPMARRPRGSNDWQQERARLDDPELLRNTTEGVFPVVWWGDLQFASDGSILGVIYPGRLAGPEFNHEQVICYRSADHGRSWQVQGRILYRPDPKADPLFEQRLGFCEPGFSLARDQSLVAILRTTDGNGSGPLYIARSSDMGRTWSHPEAFAPNGVMPRLLLLENGIMVLGSGRPGAQLRFSLDGCGKTWSEPQSLVPVTSTDIQADSCGYTSLFPLGPDSFLVAYSWFKRPGDDGAPRKCILVRKVTVRP